MAPFSKGLENVSADELTWTFTLRDGLLFQDDEKVRAIDCTTSLARWAVKDPFGQQLFSITNEVKSLDDRRFQIRLKKPFRQMLYALGARNCFMMPERMAKTPASEQIKEYIGSGPYRFLPNEWVSGARAAWARFEKYVPRPEKPSYFAGGKVVYFDRVEWIVQPDPATAAAALQTGEVDWVELPLIDLCPMLRKSDGVAVKVFDPFGWLGVLAFNQLYPPFDNVKLRRALLPAVDQQTYMQAIVGEQTDLIRIPAGYFTEGYPMANKAGLEALSGRREVALARKLVKESGYNGEPILLMSPTDQPALAQMAQVTRSLYQDLGLNVDFQAMDWGSLVSRRANQGPPDKGGWNSFCTLWGGLTVSNPGSSYPLRANGKGGWFGWPTDEALEALRQRWFDAPDLAAQQAIAARIQQRAFEFVPFIALGEVFQPTAFRTNVTDIVKAAIPLFWGVRKT
ncbi:MAG: ABC transporter substrate-binding protein [Acetobacteraceae bacterium]|nr:ABC transporter substrate-binding protein [Acetobacteraceae bacterium]